MPAFFDLLVQEADPAVRVVLGHFIFVYIHPYMDGNGRMARLLMNTMMAAGGYHHPLREGKMSCADCHDPHGELAVTICAQQIPTNFA